MKLTQCLFKYKPLFVGVVPKFRGSALRGKHKFVPPANRGTRYMLWLEWRDQEEVMKYIEKPYITADQELDYLASKGQTHHDIDPLYTSHIEEPMQQRYATDVLQLLDRARKHEILD